MFELLVQWDKEKNGDLTPHNVARASNKRIWWKCALGHSWQTAIFTRTGKSTGCPYCAGKRLDLSTRTLASEHPELVQEWHPTKNFDLTPYDVSPGTHRKVWWRCNKGHEWQAEVKSRSSGTGCLFCANKKVIIGENDLGTTHPEIAAQWHPKKTGRSPHNLWCTEIIARCGGAVRKATSGRLRFSLVHGAGTAARSAKVRKSFPARMILPVKTRKLQPNGTLRKTGCSPHKK